MGQHMEDNYHGRYYAKAQNLAWSLRNEYDARLKDYDLLIMPTVPLKATKIPPKDCTLKFRAKIARAKTASRMHSNRADTIEIDTVQELKVE